jgi:hypothetical protein
MRTDQGARAQAPARPPAPTTRQRVVAAVGARLQGYSIAADGGASSVRLLAGGQPVAHVLRRVARPDLPAREATASPARVGFFVEVEPQAWGRAAPDGRLILQLEIDGMAAGAPVVLDARALASWARGLAGWRQPDERELWRALAHVAASGQLERLPRREREWLEAAAQARGLAMALRQGDPGGRIALGARARAGLERVLPLSLEGWCFEASGAVPGITVDTDRGGWAAEPQWVARPGIARELDAPHAEIGFVLDIPPRAWRHADESGACRLRVILQGRPLAELRLDADALRRESGELGVLLEGGPSAACAEASRRLARLEAHAAAAPRAAGWTQDDAAALARLRAACDALVLAEPVVVDAAAAGGRAVDGAASPAEPVAPPVPSLRANLEGWEGLILHGWAFDALAGGEIFELEANGQVVEFLLTRTHRVDVSRALGIAHEYPGFEIQLPSTVWRHADAGGGVDIVLRVNGTPVSPGALRLDDAAFERAMLALLPGPGDKLPALATSTGMRLRLTAVPLLLEHIEARGGVSRLSDASRTRLASVAERLALGRLVGAHAAPLRPDEAEREVLSRQRRVWRLQRLFNAALDRVGGLAAPGALAAALEQVLADPDAEGPVRVQFLVSLAPLACGDGVFGRLARELPDEVLHLYASDEDNWGVTIRIAFAAHAGDFETAADLLRRVAQAPDRGWINTECIALAVQAAVDSEAVDDGALAGRRAVMRAFAELLGALPGDVWSRLHDQALVDATAFALAADGPWPDDLADELVRAVLRCHAFVPRFWDELLRASGGRLGGLAGDLRVSAAHADFLEAVAVWDHLDGAGIAPARVADLLARLHAADHRGLRDARQWMRELVLRVLARAAAADDRVAELDGLLRLLADYFEPGEMDRFELYPRSRMRAVRGDAAVHLQQRAAAAQRGAAESAGTGDAQLWTERLRRLAPALQGSPMPMPMPMPAPALDAGERASVWPTSFAPRTRDATGGNRLRLVSPPGRLDILDDARLLVVCVVRNERVMLPHFVAHYRRLGARAFVFVDNLSDDDTRAWLAAQPDVVLYSADTDYRDSHFGVAWQQAVLAAHAPGRWALLADADEFLLYPEQASIALPTMLDALEAGGHDAARLLMIDLYPRGTLREVDFAEADPAAAAGWMDRSPFVRWQLGGGLYSNGPTWLSALRHRLIPNSPPNAFTAQKIALLRWRPWIRLSEGLHYASGLRPAPHVLYFGHYKYHAGFRDKVVLEVQRKQHFDGASEYEHYLHMVAEPDATLFDAALSMPLPTGAALGDVGSRT